MNFKKIRLISLLLVFILIFTVGCNEPNTPSENDDTDVTTDETTGGNDETTGGNDETTGGNDETTGGNDETTGGNDETTDDTNATTDAETDATDPPARPAGEYRVLITSDMHYTNLGSGYYGVSRDNRLQAWVDDILAEHERSPFDLIIIAGDMSLDYWGWNGGGTYQRNPKVSDTLKFIQKYASQLPQDVPTIYLPGNHELYTNEKWNEITGNNRNESFVLGTNLFIMPDAFGGVSDPVYESGKNDSPYTAVDMDFIRGEVDKHPECERIFLISHHFDISKESAAFKNFLMNEDRIVGLFSGHTHAKSVKPININGLTIAQTGNFSGSGDPTVANFSWGFRDIYITNSVVASRYFIPANEFYVNGNLCSVDRQVTDSIIY